MIRRTRLIPVSSLIMEDIVSTLRSFAQPGGDDTDAKLDTLVKHALRTNSSDAPAANTNRVWDRLSGRVRGPFGRIAVEGPLVSGEDVNNPKGTPAPFTIGDEAAAHASLSSDAMEQQQLVLFNSAKETMTLI